MVNINKLRGRIVERGLNIRKLAQITGIERSTLYRKFASHGNKLSVGEAALIASALELSAEDVNEIFFSSATVSETKGA